MTHAALLLYDYVPDMLERRVPHRDAHLALLEELHAAGRVRLAGATGDPVSGGAIVFDTVESAAEFVAQDPYGAAGLVTASRILPWTIAVGA